MCVTADTDTALNVGELLRDGVRFTTAEAVAIVHATCKALVNGATRALPERPDDVWLTDAGTLLITAPANTESPKSAMAALLEQLLPPATDEPADTVPTALRTLPMRLRESGDAAKSDLSDLLLVFSRYLPADSPALLQKLVRRLRGGTTSAKPDRPTTTILHEHAVDLPLQVVDLPLQVAGNASPPAERQVDSHTRAGSTLVALSVLLIVVSGFIGYRLTSSARGPAPVAASADTHSAVPVEPRIVERNASRASKTSPLEPAHPTPLLLTVTNGAFSPSFGANGTMLFHGGRNSSGQLFTTTVDDQGKAAAPEPLMNDHARNYHPRLSPDGTRVAFDSDRDGERAVYVAERSGEHVSRVSGRGYAAVPSWSPDGTRLAFIKAEPGRSRVWNLWLMNVATGELKRQTSFRSGQVWGASWFPDGHRIAYSHEDQLVLLDLQSGADEIHESPIRGRLVRTPAVSPDGRRIVFQVYRDGVWMFDVATGATRRVLDDATAEEFAWDADGRRIAFHSRRDGQWRIWLMPS